MPKDKGIQLNGLLAQGELIDLEIKPSRDVSGKIISGFVVGNTLEQNKALILLIQQGELKFNPDLGVGIADMLLNHDYLNFRHRIREHFAKDGLKINYLNLYENKPLIIDANY